MRMNPWPFTSAEKLDTQKGTRNSLSSCHRFSRCAARAVATLNISAIPTTRLRPAEVSHISGDASK